MSKMLAQVLEAPGVLEYKRIDVPQCGRDEVLVRIKTAALCNGSDPGIFEGHREYATPLVFGHEPCGVIEKAGEDVKGFAPGDRVSWWFSTGAFAEYAVVNPSNVAMFKVPNPIGDREAPLLELTAACSRAINAAQIGHESRILILGLGPSGLIMSQWAKAAGAAYVAGWDLYEMRRKKGSMSGCDAVFNPEGLNVMELTRASCGEFDIVIDAFGNDRLKKEPTFDNAIQLLKKGGRVVSYGHPSKGRRFNPFYLQRKEASICPLSQDLGTIRTLMDTGIGYVSDGGINLKSLITDELPLEEVKKGLDKIMFHPESCLKIIINIGA